MSLEFSRFSSPRARKRGAKWRLAQMIKKERGCVDCGYNEHAVALQFDHIGDDKKASVSNLIRSDYGWETILEEMNKCEVRCANCHAVVTARRKLVYREPAASTHGSASSKPLDPYAVPHFPQAEVRSVSSNLELPDAKEHSQHGLLQVVRSLFQGQQ